MRLTLAALGAPALAGALALPAQAAPRPEPPPASCAIAPNPVGVGAPWTLTATNLPTGEFVDGRFRGSVLYFYPGLFNFYTPDGNWTYEGVSYSAGTVTAYILERGHGKAEGDGLPWGGTGDYHEVTRCSVEVG